MRRAAAVGVAGLMAGTLLSGCTGPAGDRSDADADSSREATTDASQPGNAGTDGPRFDPHTPATGPRELARRVTAAEDAVRRRDTPARQVRAAAFELQVLYRQLGELARRVTAAEDAVRRRDTPARQVRAAAFELQVLYRQLGRKRRWDQQVLRSVPGPLRATVRAHLTARRELRSMHRTLSDTLPAWRIVDAAPAAELRAYYREGERRFGVPWEILAAVNLVETGMGRIRGTSVAGARGPMQFIPSTWEAFGHGDINDPHDAIMAAARYLAHNGGGEGRIDHALRRYNNHASYVAAVKAWSSVMEDDPRAYRGFYHWRIIYLTEVGDIWLPVGYRETEPIPVRRYVRAHPDHRLGTSTD